MPSSPVTTHWTGSAGNGLWDDPQNWDNGVPQPGATFTSGSDDVAIIDNSIDTTPFTVLITGSQGGGDVTLNAANPAGGTAVSLTGKLDLAINTSSSGFGIGNLTLSAGTFEIDGGDLNAANIEQDGGTLAFGAAATYGSSTLDADFFNSSFAIGNDSEVVVAPSSFLVADGGAQNVITVSSGSDLSVQGFLYLAGTLDIQSGATVTFDAGGIQSGLDGTPGTIRVEAGGALVDSSGGVFQGVTLEGGFAVADGQTVITRSATTVFEADSSGDPTTVTLGSGSELDVQNTLDLYGTISALGSGGGTVLLDSGGVVSGGTISAAVAVNSSGGLDGVVVDGGITVNGGNFTISGTTSVGNDAGPTQTIDLGGGALVVSGTLDLFNTVLQNGFLDVVSGGSVNLDPQSSESNITPGIPPVSTTWTGSAGDGQWSDAGNWTNGVPPTGYPYSNSNDDVATIDTAPQTIVIAGSQGGAVVDVNTPDPATGPAVELTGTLNLGFNAVGGGITLGLLDLFQGTFEMDGGTLQLLTVQQDGGVITFTSGSTDTLNAAGIDGNVTVDGATLVAASASFADINSPDGTSDPSTLTITGGGTVDVQGSLGVVGTIAVEDGTLLLDGGFLGGNNGAVSVVETGGPGITVAADTLLGNVEVVGGFDISNGKTITVSSGATATLIDGATIVDGATLAVGGTLVGSSLQLNGGYVILSAGSLLSDTQVTGNGPVTVANGATLTDDSIDVDFSQVQVNGNTAPTTNVSGTVTLGDPADQNPVTVNLGGGTLDVFGTLNLDDAQVTSGLIKVEQGGVLNIDSSSTLPSTSIESSTTSGLVISGQNVELTSGSTITVTPGSGLFIETGVNGDGIPSGSAGTFTVDSGATISGAGTISVTDANGSSTTQDNQGAVIANVSGGTLSLLTDNLSGFGNYQAVSGGTLVLGDGADGTTVVAGGVLVSADYTVSAGSTIEVQGAAPITSIGGVVTLAGAGSELESVSGGQVLDLENTLTTIGLNYPYSGQLDVLSGRDFDAAKALTLTGRLVVGGGTFTAPSLTGAFTGGSFPTLIGYGTIDTNLSNYVNVQASGGTLLLEGTTGANAPLTAESGATLVVPGDIGSTSFIDIYTSATVEVGGQLNGATVNFFATNGLILAAAVAQSVAAPPVTSGGSMLVLDNPDGQTVNIGGTVDGNSVHLEGVIPIMGSAGIAFTRPSPSEIEIIVTPTSGAPITIIASGDVSNTGYSYKTDSAGTGTIITFGPGGTSAKAVVLPGPNEQVNTSAYGSGTAFQFISTGRVSTSSGAMLSDPLQIFNQATGNALQGNLGGTTSATITTSSGGMSSSTTVPAFTGAATASGSFSGLTPGNSIGGTPDDSSAPPEGYGGEGTPITVYLPDTTAGLVNGTVTLGFTSTDSNGIVTPLGNQTIAISAKVYALAKAYFPKTTFYVAPTTQNTETLNLPVMDQDLTGAGLTEDLVASIAGQQPGLNDLIGAFGSSGLITEGTTDSSSLSFTVDSNPADLDGGRSDVQTGTIDVAVVTNGTDTDNAPAMSEADVQVPITVDFVQLADPSATPKPQVFYAHASTTATTETFALTVSNKQDAPPGDQESLIASVASSTSDDSSNPLTFTQGTSTGDIAAGQSNTTALTFSVDTDLSDLPDGRDSEVTGSATLMLTSDGASTGGLGTTPLDPITVPVTVDFFGLAQPAFNTLNFFTHETLPTNSGSTTTLALPVTNTDDLLTPEDNLQATINSVSGDLSDPRLSSPDGEQALVSEGQTNSSSLSFQVLTDAALVQSQGLTKQTGTFNVGLVSVPTVANFQSTTLPSQMVKVNVTIQDYADPTIEGVADPVTNLGDPNGETDDEPEPSTTIGLGVVELGSEGEHQISATNVQTSQYEDNLIVGGTDYDLAPGESDDSDIFYYGGGLGFHSETVVYDPYSSNSTSVTALTPVSVTYEWTVVQPIVPAQAWGDVHLITFDNQSYNFQAQGEFILAQSTHPNNPFQVVVRLEPMSASGSVTFVVQAGIQVGNDVVNFDPTRANPVEVDGAASNLSASNAILNLAGGQVVEIGNTYRVSLNTGEVVTVTLNGTGPGSYLNVGVSLGPNDGQNSVDGLLGPANGTANDFEAANGTYLTPNAGGTFNQSDILGTFGGSYRIAAGTQSPLLTYGAGQTTNDYTNVNFPLTAASLTDLPASVVAQAQAAVAAAGITDPTLAAQATLDYALTNMPSVLTGAQNTQQLSAGPAATQVTEDVTPPPGAGISASAQSVTEQASGSTAVTYTVYLTGSSASTVSVNYAVTAPDSNDLGAAAFGGTAPSGTLTFAPGTTDQTLTVQLPQGALGTAPTAQLELAISSTGANGIVAPTAQTEVINATPEPGPAATPALALLAGDAGTVSAGSTLALGSYVQGESVNRLEFQISNSATPPADSAGGTVVDAGSPGFLLETSTAGTIEPVQAGADDKGIYLDVNTAADGSFTDTVTYKPTDTNDSGYSAALPQQSIVVTQSVVAPAAPSLLTTGPLALGAVHMGGTDTAVISVANTAASGAAGLDIAASVLTGGLTETGAVSDLAAGSTDNSSIVVGLDTSSAGAKSGVIQLEEASDAGNGHTLAAGSAQVQVNGSVFRLAQAVASGPASTVVHVGDTVTGTITVTNAAAADGYSEGLRAVASGTGTGFTASGSTGLLAAGASDTSDLGYSVNTSQSGVVNGAVDLALSSDGTGTSGLGSTTLAAQQVGVTVAVDNYAQAALQQVSGPATLSGSGTSYTLDFGLLTPGSGVDTDSLEVLNAAPGLADLLAGNFTITSGGSGFGLTGFDAFSGLGAGQADTSPTVSISTANRGDYTETLQLSPTGSNASGYMESLAPITLTLDADVACYTPGTLILTEHGEVAVEALAIGDRVVTVSGALEPIIWVGQRSYTGRFLASNPNVQPIRFRAGSLGDGLPRRDLLVSPEHAMFIDGLLIPARCLVNGSTIVRERGLGRVDYYHVELGSHDVLLAEGAPSESFMDDDSRGMFHNATEFAALYPDAPQPDGFCARRVEGGYALEAIRKRLAVVGGEMAAVA